MHNAVTTDLWFLIPASVLGRLNVKQEEIDEMLKEAPGPINFTVFLTMFGEKLKGKRKYVFCFSSMFTSYI